MTNNNNSTRRRNCAECGDRFTARRAHARYCDACWSVRTPPRTRQHRLTINARRLSHA